MGNLLILIAAGIGALFPVLGRELDLIGWNAWQVSCMRGVFGALLLIAFARQAIDALKRAPWRSGIAAGAYAACSTLLLYSIGHAPAGLCMTTIYLFPLWTLAYEWLWAGKRRKRDALIVTVGVLGIACVATDSDWGRPAEAIGIVACAAGSFLAAAYVIAAKQAATAKVGSMAIPLMSMAGMALMCVWSLAEAPPANASGYGLVIATGTITGALYLWLLTKGIQLGTSPVVSGVLMYTEVALTILIFFLAYGEKPGGVAIIGVACVICAGIIASLPEKTSSAQLSA